MKIYLPKKTINDLAKMQLYLLMNQDFRSIGYTPSLDGQGKMSKSKGGKTVINLVDSIEEISKKISKIPSNEENYHVFISLFFKCISKKDKYLINATTLKLFYDLLPETKKEILNVSNVFCPSNISLIEFEYQRQKNINTGWN